MLFWKKNICAKLPSCLCEMTLLCMLILPVNDSYARDILPVHIDVGQAVIYCDVSSDMGREHLAESLKDGSVMTYTWDISIDEVNDYWLNKRVGSVQVSRQVVPDLVLRQWILKDSSSGIMSATVSNNKAMDFLTSLEHFPVIDKSLLQSGVTYSIRVRLYIEEGAVSDNWWNEYIKLGKTIAIGQFSLP